MSHTIFLFPLLQSAPHCEQLQPLLLIARFPSFWSKVSESLGCVDPTIGPPADRCSWALSTLEVFKVESLNRFSSNGAENPYEQLPALQSNKLGVGV